MHLEEYPLQTLVPSTLSWFEKNKRTLPWRTDKDPYHIWVSEIMLQQTRVEAVIPYYRRFLQQLPDISHLAQCPEDVLLKLWEGLGYYNRVRNMQKAARLMMEEYGGQMPNTYEEILALPGIGPYTAGAIASIAYDERVPAVDGNVLRILSRLCEDDRDVAKDSTKKQVTAVLQQVMPKEAGAFNQALMEIGAIVCLPNGEPLCEKCPWREACIASANGTAMTLPRKSKKLTRRIEQRTVLVVRDGEKVILQKRPEKGLLAGLYEFPNLSGHLRREEALAWAEERQMIPLHIEPLPAAKHIFSHIEWHMQGFLLRVADVESYALYEPFGEHFFVDVEEVQQSYAIPSAFCAYTKYANIENGSWKATMKNV